MSQPQQTPSLYFFPFPNPTPAPVDPYTVSTPHINGQIQAQTPFQFHPYDVPPIGAVPLHNHPTVPPAVDSFIGKIVGSATSPPCGNYIWEGQHLTMDLKETTEPGNFVPAAFRCEVCNAVCNSKDAFQAHTQGKKHRKNLQRQALSSLMSIQNATVKQMIPDATAATFSEELEKKKQALLNNGAAVGSLLFCIICNAACSDEVVFQMHVVGKKHASQVAKQATAARLLNVAGPPNPIFMAIPSQQPSENDTEGEPVKKSHIAQSAWCDVCMIDCNTHEVLKVHMVGKRHLKNLTKSEKVTAPVASTPPAASAVRMVDVKNEQPQNAPSGTTASAASALSKVDVKNEQPQNASSGTTPPAASTVSKVDVKNEQPQNVPSGTALPAASTVSRVDVKNKQPQNAPSGTTLPALSAVSKVDAKNEEPQNALSTRCSICNIICNNSDELNNHLSGKKHRKTLGKVNKFIGPLAPPATPPMIGPTGKPEGFKGNAAEIQKPENGAKRSRGSNEDVERKRQKVVGGGAAPDSVRVCTICNVVCNSPTAFISHLGGQKHLAMAKKEAKAGLPSQNA